MLSKIVAEPEITAPNLEVLKKPAERAEPITKVEPPAIIPFISLGSLGK